MSDILSQQQFLFLKNKVLKRDVKNLDKETVEYLSNHSNKSTLMAKSVDVLLQQRFFDWPLSPEDHQLVVERFSKNQVIPRCLQLIISQCWETDIENFSNLPIRVKLWHYVNNVRSVPKCAMCDNPTRWSKKQRRYTIHCSNRCRALDPNVEAKRITTSMKRHGHDTVFTDPQQLQKATKRCREKNGVDYRFQDSVLQNEAVQVGLDKYGDGYLQQRSQQAIQQKYGAATIGQAFKGKKYRQKASETKKKNWLPKRTKSFCGIAIPKYETKEFENVFQMLPYECVRCGNIFEDNIRDGTAPRCPICYPLNRTNWGQQELIDYCKFLGLKTIEGDRTIIPPLEVDIFLPQYKVAIEYNGLYWHNEIGSNGRIDKEYHLNKTNLCREKGIQLLHIFEDEWFSKQSIIKSMIRSKIGQTVRRIFARRCEIQKIKFSTATDFLNNNHLQGEDKSSVQYGLFYGQDLVAVMTFGKPRYNTKYEWEMIRYCSLLETSVIGGAGKLLAYFVKNDKPTSIITYADLRHSTGNLYEKLGFEKGEITPPSYFYVNINEGCTTRYSRVRFQKHKLPNLLKVYDPALSERENMKNNGYARIWDCGSIRFVKRFTEETFNEAE